MTRSTTRYPYTRALSFRALLLAGVLALGFAAVASAASWINPAGGAWSNPANWDTGDVPDAKGESAVLPALSGAYVVTLDISPTLGTIQIDAADAALDVNGFSIAGAKLVNNSGTIRNFAGDYNSNRIRNLKGGTVSVAPGGTIRITAPGLWTAGTIVAAKEIHWAGNVSLGGGGALVLNDTRLLDPNVDQDVTDQFNRVMAIGGGTTLRGTGEVFKQIIESAGLIEADVAQAKDKSAAEKVLWFNGTIRNNGTIRVLNGGHINVNRPVIFNANGLITSGPGGGSVRLEMPFKMLGSIGALSGGCGTPPPAKGFIRADGGDLEIYASGMYEGRIQRGPGGGVVKMAHVTMQNVFVDAGAELHFRPVRIYVPADRPDLVDLPVLSIGATFVTSTEMVQLITNNGTIRFTGGHIGNGGSGRMQTIIRGTGELILEDATIGNGTGDTFVNGVGHTIRGCGSINPPFLNEGTVALDCAPAKSARIGGTVIPLAFGYDGKPLRQAAGSIENRGRISIARGNVSIAGPAEPLYLLQTAVPTVVTNKGTIAAGALGRITLEKSVTVDNARGILATEGGGLMCLGGTTGATVIGGRLDAVDGSKTRKAEGGRAAADFGGNLFWVEKAVTLHDLTLGPDATLLTAEGAVTTAAGKRVVNDGTNRIAGRFVLSPGTRYMQIAGETLVEGGEFLGFIERGAGHGGAGMGPSSATIAAGPATLRFYARSEPRGFVLELPQAAEVDGRVYDAAGRQVARIADGAREAGVYHFALGRAGGAGLPSGIYFGRMIVTSAGRREVLQSRIAVIE